MVISFQGINTNDEIKNKNVYKQSIIESLKKTLGLKKKLNWECYGHGYLIYDYIANLHLFIVMYPTYKYK